jgi:hypothetical protein
MAGFAGGTTVASELGVAEPDPLCSSGFAGISPLLTAGLVPGSGATPGSLTLIFAELFVSVWFPAAPPCPESAHATNRTAKIDTPKSFFIVHISLESIVLDGGLTMGGFPEIQESPLMMPFS